MKRHIYEMEMLPFALRYLRIYPSRKPFVIKYEGMAYRGEGGVQDER